MWTLPVMSAAENPAPNSIPRTPPMPNIIEDILLSTEPNIGSPSPAPSPVTAHSTIPPTESSDSFASIIFFVISSPALSSMVGKSFALSLSKIPLSGLHGSNGASSMPAARERCAATFMPFRASSCSLIAPATHRGAVSLPENCPPPLRSFAPPYLTNAG